VEAESIDATGTAGGAAADVIAGIRPAAWNNDPSVPNVWSALPIKQILEPGTERWCIGQIACSPCAQVHSVAVSSCASSTIDGAIRSADCITSQQAANTTRARRMLNIELVDCSPRVSWVSISARIG
jgi:hypothetical protein